jgi:hypothetical protein
MAPILLPGLNPHKACYCFEPTLASETYTKAIIVIGITVGTQK